VKSVCVRTGDTTGPMVIATSSVSQTLQMPIVVYGDLAEAEIFCNIIIGGVTYTDGTTTKILKKINFDSMGVYNLFFIKPTAAHANCHKFAIKQGVTSIAN
jgi:predicted solute-binding protein